MTTIEKCAQEHYMEKLRMETELREAWAIIQILTLGRSRLSRGALWMDKNKTCEPEQPNRTQAPGN